MATKKLKGQVSLFNIFRTECLINKGTPCNIYNTHDVAVEIGMKCEYGCCYSCNVMRECGACCNTARYKEYR